MDRLSYSTAHFLAARLAVALLPGVMLGQSNEIEAPSAASVVPSTAANAPGNGVIVNAQDGQRYVWIPPGAFTMGCSQGDTECDHNEKPPHAARIENGFWLGRTEVTQAAYQRVTGGNPSAHRGDPLPVESVSWNDASNYCAAIGGRLPTEVEWEYAARGRPGVTGARYGDLDAVAWHSGNSGSATHPVANKEPNAFGLYDMLGNVWEWTADSYPGSTDKVERGGSYGDGSQSNRVSVRASNAPTTSFYLVGFRCAVGGGANLSGAAAKPSAAQSGSGTTSDRVYRVGNGVSQPQVISKVDPGFSRVGAKLLVVGAVLLQLVVQPDGTASDFKVIRSLGYGLDESAIECVRKWRFKPGMKDGTAVPVYATVELNFRPGWIRGNYWHSLPMAFAAEPGLTPPVVEDGTMPKSEGDVVNGSVVLEFTVDFRGSVKNIRPVYGPPSASKLLAGHLAKWKFQPAVKRGQPVEATGQVRFIIGQGDEAWKLPLTPPAAQSSPPEPVPAPETTAPSTDAGRISAIAPKPGDTKPSLASVDGRLRKKPGEKDLYLQTNDQSVLRFRLIPKTQFHDQQGAPIRDSLLRPGDQVSVLVHPDDPETALQVVLLRNGTEADRESAERPVTESLVRAPEPRDLVKNRIGTQDAAPPATVPSPAPAPTTESGAIAPDRVFPPGNGVSMPVVLNKVAPEYSDVARTLRAEGIVLLQCVVPPNGKPQDCKVLRPVGYGLDDKAIEAVRKWRYKPGMKDGRAVSVRMTQEVIFSLGVGTGVEWSSGPMAFAREDGLALPVVRTGALPTPDGTEDKSVVLEFTVDPSGAVKNIQSLYGSATASELLSACLEKWQFLPAVKDNQPVDVTGRVRFVKGQIAEEPVASALMPPPPRGNPPVVKPGAASQPRVLLRVDPEYSETARKEKYSGTVLLQLVVDVDGRAKDIKVVKGVGLGLDEKAIEAVRKWIFRPASKDGVAVPIHATVEVNFRLL